MDDLHRIRESVQKCQSREELDAVVARWIGQWQALPSDDIHRTELLDAFRAKRHEFGAPE